MIVRLLRTRLYRNKLRFHASVFAYAPRRRELRLGLGSGSGLGQAHKEG